jgi:hypothetical protein
VSCAEGEHKASRGTKVDVATAGYVVHEVHPASFYPRSRLSRRSAFLAYVASSPVPRVKRLLEGQPRGSPPPRLAQSSPSGPPDGNPRACEILTSLGAVLAAATRREIDEGGVATGERATPAGQAGSRPAGAEPVAGVRFTRIIHPYAARAGGREFAAPPPGPRTPPASAASLHPALSPTITPPSPSDAALR